MSNVSRRITIVEGLYSGLSNDVAAAVAAAAVAQQSEIESKMAMLVEAPAAVEDALASLLDHHDPVLQVSETNLIFGC